jgi:uncharacterized protein
MLLVLSPAKSLDFDNPVPTDRFTQPDFLDESNKLIKTLRKLSPEDLSELMSISTKLGELNFERNLNWHLPFDMHNARQAIFAFTGDVYMGLDARSLSNRDMEFAQNHLRILSGLYGVLRPLDLIQPYRLEMGTSLRHGNNDNLYTFWSTRVTDALNQVLANQKTPWLLNLASQEYFRAVRQDALIAPVISPVFKDYKNGQYKIISFFAKKARGMMAAHVIRHRVSRVEDLLAFSQAGYRYSGEHSTSTSPVFLRKTTGSY